MLCARTRLGSAETRFLSKEWTMETDKPRSTAIQSLSDGKPTAWLDLKVSLKPSTTAFRPILVDRGAAAERGRSH